MFSASGLEGLVINEYLHEAFYQNGKNSFFSLLMQVVDFRRRTLPEEVMGALYKESANTSSRYNP